MNAFSLTYAYVAMFLPCLQGWKREAAFLSGRAGFSA